MATERVPAGLLFVVEGPDGVGKTTLTTELANRLEQESRSVQSFSFPGRTLGTLGEVVYRLHHDIGSIDQTALQILHVAAHVDLITRFIKPLLIQGTDVVLDRFWWSTLVYSRVNHCNMEAIRAALEAEFCAWGDVVPTVIVLLDRSEPFRPEHDAATFAALRSAYRDMVDASILPVAQISSNYDTSQLAIDILKEYINT